jgi:hypothetical protein
MKRCQAIKANGGRCERIVSAEQEYCYSHDPARQSERRRNAARGGRVKASSAAGGEIGGVKAQLQALADATLAGEVDTRVAAVTCQIFNTYLSAIRTELKVKEVAEFEARLAELERLAGVAS